MARLARHRACLTLAGVCLLAGCGGTASGGGALVRDPAPALPTTGTALVWAVGDGDAGSASKRLVARIRRSRPDLFLYLGDVYEHGTRSDFRRHYDTTFGKLGKLTAPTPGNHDGPQSDTGYRPYWRAVKGRRQPLYYTLEVAGWTLISLDSETSHGASSKQVRWLKRKLRGAKGTCRLAFWHRPRYSAGSVHGDSRDVEPFWRVLKGHARLVLGGHEHGSQRLKRRRGITEFVAGAGGHSLYPIAKKDRGLAFADDSHFAALKLRLSQGRARMVFVTASGRVLDRSSVRCR